MTISTDNADFNFDELAAIVGRDNVLTNRSDALAYARDCWMRPLLLLRDGQLPEHMPDVVVLPDSVEQISHIVRFAARHRLPIIPYGAGSGVCGGTMPIHGGIIIDLKRLDQVLELDAESRTVTAQAGILGVHLESELNRRGYTLGHYPSSMTCSTLGGYLATRSAGQYSSRFGKIEDMVLSMQVVLGTGMVIDTFQADHFDLTQLLVGNEGTLGVIVAATLQIEPAPETRIYRGFKVDLEDGLTAVRKIMQAGLRPACLRLYDELDSLVTQHGQQDHCGLPRQLLQTARRVIGTPLQPKLHAVSRELLARAFGKPLLMNRLARALPGSCLLVLAFEGREEICRVESNIAFKIGSKLGRDLGPGPGQHWYDNRFANSYKVSPLVSMGAFVDSIEVSATYNHLLDLYRAVRKKIATRAVVLAHFSHAYPEGCSITFTFAGSGHTLTESLEKYDHIFRSTLLTVAHYHGSTTHHHGVGLLKRDFTDLDQEGGAWLYHGLKRVLDPHGVMNPGKVWPEAETTSNGRG